MMRAKGGAHMGQLRKFWTDERGDVVKSISLMAFAVALASIGGASFLDKASRDGGVMTTVSNQVADRYSRAVASLPRPGGGNETNQQVTVDYTPIGSIPNNLSQPIILDPCTGVRK